MEVELRLLRLTWPVHLVLDPHRLAFVAVLIGQRPISVDHPVFEQSFVLDSSFQVVLRKRELALPVKLVVKHIALILLSTGQCKSLAIALLACLHNLISVSEVKDNFRLTPRRCFVFVSLSCSISRFICSCIARIVLICSFISPYCVSTSLLCK